MITHVAIQYNGKIYSLEKPARHHDVIRMIAKENGVGVKGSDTQGFLTSDGTFLNRRDAFKLASTNGQMLPRGPNEYNGGELFSEDLW